MATVNEIGARLETIGKSMVDPGVVYFGAHYAVDWGQYVQQITDKTTGYPHGWIIKYLGWTGKWGAGTSEERVLRYSVIGMMRYEEKRKKDGQPSYGTFVDEIEEFAHLLRADHTMGINGVHHNLLRCATDIFLLVMKTPVEERLHVAPCTIDVRVNSFEQ